MTVPVPVRLADTQVAFAGGEPVHDIVCDLCRCRSAVALVVIVVDRDTGVVQDVRVAQACSWCGARRYGDGR